MEDDCMAKVTGLGGPIRKATGWSFDSHLSELPQENSTPCRTGCAIGGKKKTQRWSLGHHFAAQLFTRELQG
jgi:hypothetical protein